MEEYSLKLRISPSDNEFKKLVGEDYNNILLNTFKRDGFTCKGCGYHPLDESKASKYLYAHVESINEENPKESPCTTLCMACHTTQHIDIAIERDWVQLLNSTFSQRRLIETCRINAQLHTLNNENSRFLKTNPKEFLQKLKDGTLSPNSRAKVIFTSKFQWGDL